MKALFDASSQPFNDAVCAVPLGKIPLETHHSTLGHIAVSCNEQSSNNNAEHSFAECFGEAAQLYRPLYNETNLYGAAIFCSHAAMRLLHDHLADFLSDTYMNMWTQIGIDGVFNLRDFAPVSDVILSKCMRDLGIQLFDLTPFFGGDLTSSHLTKARADGTSSFGNDQPENTAVSLRFTSYPSNLLHKISISDVKFPAMFHKVLSETQFGMLKYFLHGLLSQ